MVREKNPAGYSPLSVSVRSRRGRPPYRSALVGCGRVGFLLERDALRPKPCTHAGGVVSHTDFNMVAGCDINPERLADFGRTFGIGPDHLYADVDEMLRREKLDLLNIATWTESHDVIVRKACRRKIPAVVCEKPMAVTWDRARRMAASARRSGVLLLINHGRRWSPEYRSVRTAVREKRYGELRHVQGCVLTSFGRSDASWHSSLEKSGGGPLLHDGTHLFDIVFFLTGLRPSWIDCRIDRRPGSAIEHHAAGRIVFRGNPAVEFCFEAGGARNYFHFEVELWFDSGRILVGNGIRRAETSVSSSRYSGFQDLAADENFTWESAIGTADHVGVSELAAWFSGGPEPENVTASAIASQEAIFAAYESAVRRRPVKFPYRSRWTHPLLVRPS